MIKEQENMGVVINNTGPAESLSFQQIDRPSLSAGQVLVRNHSTGVNYIDTLIRSGNMPEGMMPDLPFVPGVEGAGIIEEVSGDANGIDVGDRVAWFGAPGSGGYGHYTAIDQNYVVKIPKNTSFSEAAAVPVNYATAWHMLVNLGRVQRGDWVLVRAAAGGVGTAILQIGRHLGLNMIALAGPGKGEYVRDQGATDYIDYTSEDIRRRVSDIIGDATVALTLNPVGGDSIAEDFELLGPFGQAIHFGFLAGPPSGALADTIVPHFQKSIGYRVSDIYTYHSTNPTGLNEDLKRIFQLVESGEVTPRVHEAIPISEAARAHMLLESGKTIGKVVLDHL